MINLFRKTRKKMADDNRPLKYMRYAVGEIALVVIGILIALSINNWNQERINDIEAKTYIKAIYNDLINDTLMLSKKITLYKELLQHNNGLIDETKSDTAYLETFINVAKNFNPTFTDIEAFNNSTLSSIESTGKLDLLNQNLKKELLEYKLMQESSVTDRNVDIYLDHINNFSTKYKFGAFPNKYMSRLNSTFKDEQEYVNLFSSLIGYKSYMMRVSLSNWNYTLTKAKIIISLIKTGDDD
jgi:hypothetical protein